ncbi:hypothetical protein HII31_07850 [Pseudocercospora fuligena]|uniref:DNL-type domain-containing protein n=1 Tax=Pseudocercospora fuligena TaxID=685502 RepID=A0A8H6RGK3_9PEZI|nr:hypothetical protein HII31_07850 [Pseudocercospora fuligena]
MNTSRTLRAFQRTFEQTFRTYHTPVRLPYQPKIRIFPSAPRIQQRRYNSTESSSPKPLTDRPETSLSDAEAIATRKALSPAYQLHFTCKKCLERSSHTVSKQAYHFGTCVINCPKCKTQHLISDHLKIFSDKGKTLEEIAKEHGEILKKGKLGVDGDVEFYEDYADKIVEDDHMRMVEGRREIGEEKMEAEKKKQMNEVNVEKLKAAIEKQQSMSEEERKEQQAVDDRIRDALRETSRRQDG